ncbi:MAG: HAD-IA family hydrolase [Nitrospiraceae bacterium]
MSIHTVLFDAAETLFTLKRPVSEIYLETAVRHGFRPKPDAEETLKAAFRRAMADAPPPVFLVDDPKEIKRCERLWWFDVVHNVFYRVGMFERFDDFFDDVFQQFDGPSLWVLYPDTIATLQTLRARGMELGIVSNFDSRLFSVLRGLGLDGLFDTVTISSLARAAKPAPGIFRAAMEKHAVEPEDVVHIGDSLKEDMLGAKNAGVLGVWVDRSSGPAGARASVDMPVTPAHRITTLSELPAILDGLE